MDDTELARKLASLGRLDFDAVSVYSEALAHVTDDTVRASFEQFQADHKYHAEHLAEAVERLGGEKPEPKVDLMGQVADLVTALRSRGGTVGALHAMLTAEHFHNSRYGDAATWDVGDEEIATLLKRFFDDEKHHLAFIEEHLGKGTPAADGEASPASKVEDAPENAERCRCPSCPTFDACMREKQQALFCARGNSDCVPAPVSCLCGECPVWAQYELSGYYFCIKGAAA